MKIFFLQKMVLTVMSVSTNNLFLLAKLFKAVLIVLFFFCDLFKEKRLNKFILYPTYLRMLFGSETFSKKKYSRRCTVGSPADITKITKH